VAVFVLLGAGTLRPAAWTPFLADGTTLGAGLGLGVAVVMWNYSGWDLPSTTLGETRAPERTFRLALFLALPAIMAAYVLPMAVGLASGAIPWRGWDTGAFPRVAAHVGGAWLGHAVAAGAVVSMAGMFLSLLLTNSRLPYVLARDRLLPAALRAIHGRFGTPWVAVVASALCYSAFAAFSFKELVVLNIWLYSLALLVELAAFLRLRVSAPAMPRPWRVPGGAVGALLAVACPAALCLVAMATADWRSTIAGLVAAGSGPAAYVALRRLRGA
jgi:amino acid transporter